MTAVALSLHLFRDHHLLIPHIHVYYLKFGWCCAHLALIVAIRFFRNRSGIRIMSLRAAFYFLPWLVTVKTAWVIMIIDRIFRFSKGAAAFLDDGRIPDPSLVFTSN